MISSNHDDDLTKQTHSVKSHITAQKRDKIVIKNNIKNTHHITSTTSNKLGQATMVSPQTQVQTELG